jgi:glycosyltransferase involved in cell wall biosynthesis
LAFARETLESMACQTDRCFECLVVDQGDDEGLSLVRQYESRLELRILRSTESDWMRKTNLGFARARGQFVCMLHTDDRWHPERVERLRSASRAHPRAGLIFHPVRYVDAGGAGLGYWRSPLPAGRLLPGSEVLEHLIVQNFISCPAPAIRRDLVGEGIDARLWYTGDWDLYLRLAAATDVLYLNDVLADFRLHSTSLTIRGSSDRDTFSWQLDEVLRRHADRLPAGRRQRLVELARFSNAVNVALADVFHGRPLGMLGVLPRALGLGAGDFRRYLDDSRIVERTVARLRLAAGRVPGWAPGSTPGGGS